MRHSSHPHPAIITITATKTRFKRPWHGRSRGHAKYIAGFDWVYAGRSQSTNFIHPVLSLDVRMCKTLLLDADRPPSSFSLPTGQAVMIAFLSLLTPLVSPSIIKEHNQPTIPCEAFDSANFPIHLSLYLFW